MRHVTLFIALSVMASLFARETRADWRILPDSRHHLYESYSFFIEQQNTVAYRGGNLYWAAVATAIPLAGDNESPLHPQILFFFSGNDSMHVNDGGGVFTETLDTRIGILGELALPLWELRFSFGFLHESGHVADGTDDPDLIPLNLGDNVVRMRLMRDFGRMWRVGLTVVPIIHAIPETLSTGMDEFVEFFPLESNEDSGKPSPYAAMGISNRLDFSGSATFHAQAGVAFGSHFQDKHSHSARLALGYYHGTDPRAKYAQFDGLRANFGYLAVMFNL